MGQRLANQTILVGELQLAHGVRLFDGLVTPVNGGSGTGAGKTGPASLYFRTTGKTFINTGTQASPTWSTLWTGAASISPSKSPSASVSPS